MPVADPLAKTHPDLAAQWHPTRNAGLTPEDVRANSYKKVWWRCPIDSRHEWEAKIGHRTRYGNACSFCSGRKTMPDKMLAVLFPAIAAEWHPTNNGALRPETLSPGSMKKISWQCLKDSSHTWRASAAQRTRQGTGCPYCAGRRQSHGNSFAARYPKLIEEWHPTMNGELRPEQMIANSREMVWWQCRKNPEHVWQTQARSRIKRDNGCPSCRDKSPKKRQLLAESSPTLVAEWHPIRNGDLKPTDVTAGSSREVWWQCAKDGSHEWQASISGRSRGNGCPVCAGQLPHQKTSLATLQPGLAQEWHLTKNGALTPNDVTPGSARLVWWRCTVDPQHEWQAKVLNRSRGSGTGCPACAGVVPTADNNLATLHPNLAAQWDAERNGSLMPSDVSCGSERKVWWRCADDPTHVWKAQVKNRVALGSGCPACRTGWTVSAVRAFVDALKHHLAAFTPAELYVLFQQNGLLSGQRDSQAFLDALATGRFPFGEIEKFCRGEKSLVDRFLADQGTTLENLTSATASGAEQQGELGLAGDPQTDEAALPAVETVDVLRSLQSAVVVSADQEAVEFLVASALAKIWKHAFRDEVAVDGVVPEGHLRSPAQAYQDVMGWLGRLTTGDVEVVSRTPIDVALSPNAAEAERRTRSYGDFSAMNRRWNQTGSVKTAERLRQSPDEWAHYHTLYREARKTWAVVSFEEVIRWAEKRSGYVIGDFGCGEAKLATTLSDRHTVHSFDYIAASEDVIACDMAHVPMEDETLDVAVFSLSLMGANFTDYLREAWRLVKLDGHLHIYEATSRFTNRDGFADGLKRLGFSVVTIEHAWKFTHIHALKMDRQPDAPCDLTF